MPIRHFDLTLTGPPSRSQRNAFVDVRIFDDHESGRSFEYPKDFDRYSEVLPDYDRTVNELMKDGTPVQQTPARPDAFAHSYRGAAAALLTEGPGERVHGASHLGASLTFTTANGDNMYPVYREICDGQIY